MRLALLLTLSLSRQLPGEVPASSSAALGLTPPMRRRRHPSPSPWREADAGVQNGLGLHLRATSAGRNHRDGMHCVADRRQPWATSVRQREVPHLGVVAGTRRRSQHEVGRHSNCRDGGRITSSGNERGLSDARRPYSRRAGLDALAQGRSARTNLGGARTVESRFRMRCWSPTAVTQVPTRRLMVGRHGDGTMRSGSAVTLVATGTPTNTVENGWPVRESTSAQNDQEPANVAFPANDFSAMHSPQAVGTVGWRRPCVRRRRPRNPPSRLPPFGNKLAAPTLVHLGWALDRPNFTAGTFAAGVWNHVCFTYQRVGGRDFPSERSTSTVWLLVSSTMRLAQALSSVWSTNHVALLATAPASNSIAAPWTSPVQAPQRWADISRIYAATAP